MNNDYKGPTIPEELYSESYYNDIEKRKPKIFKMIEPEKLAAFELLQSQNEALVNDLEVLKGINDCLQSQNEALEENLKIAFAMSKGAKQRFLKLIQETRNWHKAKIAALQKEANRISRLWNCDKATLKNISGKLGVVEKENKRLTIKVADYIIALDKANEGLIRLQNNLNP